MYIGRIRIRNVTYTRVIEMLCSLVLCVILSLNLSKAEGIPSDARTATKKFQNALTQQNLQTVLLSIEERLRNLDHIYSMQYSPSVEGKLELYSRKLENVDAKISRLEAVMSNELNKISENISSKNFKADLTRDYLLRKIDSLYDRVNHRLIFAETKMELIERKIENKLDSVLLKIEKMEDNIEIKDADVQGEIADVLSCIEEIKTKTDAVEHKIVNISKVLNENPQANLQSDEKILSATYENITATVRKDMKENFEVLSNKIVDFHESSWQTYDHLEKMLKSMSLVSNLTRYEIQNGLRSLTVEVGRLGGGQGLLSDATKEKSKLHEIDKKIDSNFESLMLAQNLFMENCYRLQKDEPQLETKISEVLDEMINTFNAKTSVEPKDIKRLEQIMKNHDQGVKNAFKSLGSILYESRLTDKQIERSLNSLDSIKTDLVKLNNLVCDSETNATYQKLEEAVLLLENVQGVTTDLNQSVRNVVVDTITTSTLQQAVEKLESFIGSNTQEVLGNLTNNYTNSIKKLVENIVNNISTTKIIFNENYSHHFKLFLDEYARKYIKRINEVFDNTTEDGITDTTNVVKQLAEIIKSNCFTQVKFKNLSESQISNCLKGTLKEDAIKMIHNYCSINIGLSEEACLREIVGLTNNNDVLEEINSTIIETIKTNCFYGKYLLNSENLQCLKGILNEDEINKIRNYCRVSELSADECLRNITGLQFTNNIIQELGVDTIEIIKSNCFPLFDLRNSQNSRKLECLNGILNDDVIAKIRSYCILTSASSEEACLNNIIRMKSSISITEELEIETIEIIKSNCFPNNDLRNTKNFSNFECLKDSLDENTITQIRNYCSLNLSLSEEEDCLRNITGLKREINIIEAFGVRTIEIIKTNCFPNFDVRISQNSSNFECLKDVLNDTIIVSIRNYCSLNALSEEACLRNITSLRRELNIIEVLGVRTIETIKTNCFPNFDVRISQNSSNFKCLKDVLNDTIIESIRNYCSSNALSEEDCLKNITDFKFNDSFIKGNDSEIIEKIKNNCFPTFDVRQSLKLIEFQCLYGVLDEDVIEKIKNYCILSLGSSEESCLRNITGLVNMEIVNMADINREAIDVIKSNCFLEIDVRHSTTNSNNFKCLKGLLNNEIIRKIKNYCAANMIYSEEECLKNLVDTFNVTENNILATSNNGIHLNNTEENSDESIVEMTSTNTNPITIAITTTEADYYQALDSMVHSEYEDYSTSDEGAL